MPESIYDERIHCSAYMPISRWSMGSPAMQTQWSYSKVGRSNIDKLLVNKWLQKNKNK